MMMMMMKCHDICILEAWMLYFSGYSVFRFCSG